MWKTIILGCLVLAGCDTMNGLGQDMQQAGHNLSDRAVEQKGPPPAPAPYVPAYPTPYEPEEP